MALLLDNGLAALPKAKLSTHTLTLTRETGKDIDTNVNARAAVLRYSRKEGRDGIFSGPH